MAATLNADQDLVYASFPIEKWEEGPEGSGSVYVYGKATTPEIDTDEQIVDSAWSAASLKSWLADGPALRVQHNPQRDPAGSGVAVDINRDGDGAHWVKSVVDEPAAVRLVKKGHLRAYSVGIARPVIERDMSGKARNGIIKGGRIAEVSLVDSPANRSCMLELVKADEEGRAAWSGKMIGADDILAKTDEPDVTKTAAQPITASLTFSPGDLAKLLEHRRAAEEREAEAVKADTGGDEEGGGNAEDDDEDESSSPDMSPDDDTDCKTAEPDWAKARTDEVTALLLLGKDHREFTAEQRREHAKEGNALPDGSYPIPDKDALRRAAILARSGHGDVAAARKLIARRAKELGVANPLADDDKVKKEAASRTGVTPEDLARAIKKALRTKTPCPACGANCKTDSAFCGKCGTPMTTKCPTPADGAVGVHAEHVPPHREPDGAAMEHFETDAGMAEGDEAAAISRERQTGPPAAEEAMSGKMAIAAAVRARQAGAGPADAVLHDLLCPAYDPGDVAKCYPGTTIADAADPGVWQAKALDAAATAPLDEAGKAQGLWQHAVTLKATEADEFAELRAEAHKAFRDAQPSPTTFPTPTELSPTRFRRPYISEGHAASPAPSGNGSPGHVPAGQPSASQYQRGPLTSGHAAESPSNEHQAAPVQPPSETGRPSRTFYRNTSRESARQAMQSMHDHIASTFPDLCPMHGPGHEGAPPIHARPVPVPHTGKTEDEPEVTKTEAAEGDVAGGLVKAAAKPAKTPCSGCGKKVKSAAPFCAGCGKKNPARTSTDKAAEAAVPAEAAPNPPLGADVIKTAVAEALAPLAAQLKAQQDTLREQGELIDQMAAAPDPRYAPFKAVAAGGVLPKAAAAAPAESPVEKARNAAQTGLLAEMQHQARYDPDPGTREAAWATIKEMLSLRAAPATR